MQRARFLRVFQSKCGRDASDIPLREEGIRMRVSLQCKRLVLVSCSDATCRELCSFCFSTQCHQACTWKEILESQSRYVCFRVLIPISSFSNGDIHPTRLSLIFTDPNDVGNDVLDPCFVRIPSLYVVETADVSTNHSRPGHEEVIRLRLIQPPKYDLRRLSLEEYPPAPPPKYAAICLMHCGKSLGASPYQDGTG